MDIYANFAQLQQHEAVDAFEITLVDRQAVASIIAPHGGNIEPGTTDLAHLIAADSCNLYVFNACKEQNSPDLHITSHHFDEPQCLALLSRSRHAITVHGFKFDRAMIYLGGLDTGLKQHIFQSLLAAGLPVGDDHPKYQGKRPSNICNRTITGMGVQLEVSRHLRSCEQQRFKIAQAVQEALRTYKTSLEASTI